MSKSWPPDNSTFLSHLASLIYAVLWNGCAGSLIHNDIMLSAAHVSLQVGALPFLFHFAVTNLSLHISIECCFSNTQW